MEGEEEGRRCPVKGREVSGGREVFDGRKGDVGQE